MPQRTDRRNDDAGGAMILLLLALMLIGAITLSVMRLIAAETGGGIKDLQSGQVFNIAQAGIHYAIGKLQLPGASSYAGETIAVTSGTTTLGTATTTVNCPDTGTAPPCGGPYAGYRRIISTGTLPSRGPIRTIVTVVEATAGRPAGVCAYAGGVDIGRSTIMYSDVGSNAAITLAGGSPSGQIRADQNVPQQFKGAAVAMGSVSCGSSCSTQVQGDIVPRRSVTVCPAMTPPTYSPGAANLYVGSGGLTMNDLTRYSWKDVYIAPGPCAGPTPFTDLNLQADPSNPNATTVVQINSLIMSTCSRIVILGSGKIELRIGKSDHNSLFAFPNTRFAVLPSDTLNTPAPVPARRFVVWINSTGSAGATTAVQFIKPQIVAGTILAPQGRIYSSAVTFMAGALWADTMSFDGNSVFSSDTSGLPADVTVTYANFNLLRSWKDQ